MTENKRFIPSGRWIKDNYVGTLLNIDFNTTIDRDMCCKFLNRLEDKKSEYGKIADKYFEENKQLKEENKELRQDNDIKFWKLQCMNYFNSNSLFMSEISRAIKKGYEVSEQFQKYLDELKENNKEIKEKNKRLFGDSE